MLNVECSRRRGGCVPSRPLLWSWQGKQHKLKMKTISTILAATISLILLTSARAQDTAGLPAAAKPVFDHYISIQNMLAKDSTSGVSEAATNIVKEMEG